MKTVALSTCDTYQIEKVKASIQENISHLGGWERFVRPGEKVLLKVNLVSNKAPEAAATSHPVFVQALAELLQDYGASVIIGDSPGGLFNEEILKRIYRGTGMDQAAEASGAVLNYNTGSLERSFPEGKILHSITQVAMLQDVDKVISVSKLKTHAMMVYTGAVKNQFGTVPGTKKAEYHFRMPEAADFANALIDICLAASPVLYVMDAIVAMEGNGPTNGQPRPLGLVLASEDPFALDLCGAGLIGLGRKDIPVLEQAYLRQLGPADVNEVNIVGEKLEDWIVSDFKMPDHIEPDLSRRYGKWLQWLSPHLRPKVIIHPQTCIGCRTCYNNCPAHAMTMVSNHYGSGRKKTMNDGHIATGSRSAEKQIPKIDYSACIRCFCCQELCPKNAISIRESRIMKIANRL